MLKIAYQKGVEMAIKEAGLTTEEFDKLAKFLWYRDVAGAIPTFRRWMGLNPEMGHRVAQSAKKVVAPQVRKSVSKPAQPGIAKFQRGAFSKKK